MPYSLSVLRCVPSCARRLRTLLLLTILIGSVAHDAHAQAMLEVPASCGDRAEFEREVATLKVSEANVPQPPVRLYGAGEEFVLQVQLADGPRELRDNDCRSLFRAAVLIAALGARVLATEADDANGKPSAATELAPVQPLTNTEPAVSTPAPIAAPAATPSTRDASPSPTALPWRMEARGAGSWAYGYVPKHSLALDAGLALQRGRWGLSLRAGYLTPRSLHDGPEGVRIDGYAAALALELDATRWLRLSLGGAWLGLRGRGLDVSRAERDWAALLAAELAASLRIVQWGRVGLWVLTRGFYTADPPRFSMRGRSVLYTASSFAFQAGLGVSVQIL